MNCGVKNLLRNVITFVLAVVLIMSVVPLADAQAAKVKNGLQKASNGYYYCYKNGSKPSHAPDTFYLFCFE